MPMECPDAAKAFEPIVTIASHYNKNQLDHARYPRVVTAMDAYQQIMRAFRIAARRRR